MFGEQLVGGLGRVALIVFFKLPLHLLYLGKPLRFWRTMPPFSKRVEDLLVREGVLFTFVFIALGLVQIELSPARDRRSRAPPSGGVSVVDWTSSSSQGSSSSSPASIAAS